MPWFNVDDGFSNSKPVLRIPRRYRCTAIGLWTMAGSWSAKELTDGFIPDHAIEEFCSTPAMAELLVRAGLWKRVAGGWQFENWSKYQKTKEQVYAYRSAEAERKRLARSKGKPPGDEGASGVDTGRTDCGVPPGLQAESGLPIPKPLPIPKSLENLGGEVALVDAQEPRPQCAKHETNSATPCPACLRRRTWDEDHADQLAANELDEKRRLRDDRESCLRCHGTNTYELRDGMVRKCWPHQHQEAVNA